MTIMNTMRVVRNLGKLLLLVVWSSGCSKQNAVSQNTYNTTEELIGSQGGIVEGPDGVELRVPAGALAEQVAFGISVAEPGEYPPLDAKWEVLGKVYAFTPHGQSFRAPVIISLPDPGQATTILRAEIGGSWQSLTSDISAGTAEASITRFSFYTAAREAPVAETPTATCSGRGPAVDAPSGSLSNLSGIRGVDLSTMVDGYVELTGGTTETAAIILTPYARACGHCQNGLRKIGATQIRLTGANGRFPNWSLTTATYSPDQLALTPETLTASPGACEPPAVTVKNLVQTTGPGLTVTALDNAHVAGTLDITLAFDGRVTFEFDLPICSPRSGLEPAWCCIE